MAAVSSQVSPPAPGKIEKYREAMKRPREKANCRKLQSLAKDLEFELHEVALIRHAEYCGSAVPWMGLSKQINNPILRPFLHQAQFRKEFTKKRYVSAYRVYDNHRDDVEVDDADFDQLALQALKGKLTKKEKADLRNELYKRSPRFLPNPKKSDFRRVARDFRSDRQFDKALFYYRKVLNDPKQSLSERWKAFRGARITYKLERWSQMKKYIKATRQWADFLRKDYKKSPQLTKLHHDANIDYVRTLWTEKGQEEARPPLLKLEKELKNRYSLQMVYWLKGRMAEERKQYKKAVEWLDQASKEKAITLADRDRVLWSLAWNQRRIGQHKESQQALDRLKKSEELTFFAKTKYLYWYAENLDSMKKTEESAEAMARLADLDAYGYYGALAYRKLKVPFPKPPKPEIDSQDILDLVDPKQRQFFTKLIEAKEFEISQAIATGIEHKNHWSTGWWVRYLHLLQKAGAFKEFFVRYHSLSPKKQLAVMEDHPYLLFPQPYKEEVFESSKLSKVSPALIYSIMKQESGFDVKARSHADAFGLLQLIPQVAKKAAQRMPSVDYQSPYDLYRPDVIIPLGADSLNHLFKKFDSNFILSVASYNASEQAVRSWITSRFQGDPVTFIEDIPYEETKGYVKLVMRNYITYNRFEEKEGPFLFPEICLGGLDEFKNRKR